MSGMDASQPWHAIDPKQGPFPGLPTFSELHTELARHRRRDPDAKLIAAYDALLVLCERISVLEAEARKPYMPAARVRAMGGYDGYEETVTSQDRGDMAGDDGDLGVVGWPGYLTYEVTYPDGRKVRFPGPQAVWV